MTADGRAAIELLRAADGSLSRPQIARVLPYGGEFLFLDRVSRLEDSSIDAEYEIPTEAPYLQAHFRDLPLMPGALIAESCAQAGTLLVRYNLEGPADRHLLAYQIDRAVFVGPAFPGERLQHRVRLETLGRRSARLSGSTRVGMRPICKLRFILGIASRERLLAAREAARGG